MQRKTRVTCGLFTVGLSCLALTACASRLETAASTTAEPFPEGVLRAYVWQCADGRQVLMGNLLRERAVTIDLQDGNHRLDRTVSASGVRYANADESIVFWTKGDTATLARAGAGSVTCQERRAESLREDARLRGVTYRALGNEPGWVLEIGPGTRLDWVTNFGTEHHTFAESTATVTPEGTTYTAGQGSDSFEVTIRAERCVDDGEIAYDHTALVEFRGSTLRGCATRFAAR